MSFPASGRSLYVQRSKQGTFDIFRLPLAAGASPAPVLESRLDKSDARVSPDGRAIAFAALDGQRTDLYVAPLPCHARTDRRGGGRLGRRHGGARDGRRLYYVGDSDRMMTIAVRTDPALTVGTPRQALPVETTRSVPADVARDGRFLAAACRSVRASQRPISVATAAIRGDRP